MLGFRKGNFPQPRITYQDRGMTKFGVQNDRENA